jgi:hypothetical protein
VGIPGRVSTESSNYLTAITEIFTYAFAGNAIIWTASPVGKLTSKKSGEYSVSAS